MSIEMNVVDKDYKSFTLGTRLKNLDQRIWNIPTSGQLIIKFTIFAVK